MRKEGAKLQALNLLLWEEWYRVLKSQCFSNYNAGLSGMLQGCHNAHVDEEFIKPALADMFENIDHFHASWTSTITSFTIYGVFRGVAGDEYLLYTFCCKVAV